MVTAFISRYLVNKVFDVNVFVYFTNSISIFYYLGFSIYSVIIKLNIQLFNFPVIPSFYTIIEFTKKLPGIIKILWSGSDKANNTRLCIDIKNNKISMESKIDSTFYSSKPSYS
jgi:hypothetical protein